MLAAGGRSVDPGQPGCLARTLDHLRMAKPLNTIEHAPDPLRWDIFCKVVDNYGDIGVCWRLARQLAKDYGQQVRLWLDDLGALARICPQAQVGVDRQQLESIEVRRWSQEARLPTPTDLVIEAFACQLPSALIDDMARQRPQPLWLNLEYLSAEDWIEGCHALPSPQPGGLRKYFFFPGFTLASGGLPRERDLLRWRRVFQADRPEQLAFLGGLGVTPQAGQRRISLFSYENPNLPVWLDALVEGPTASLLLVPEGRVLAGLSTWAGAALKVGSHYRRGRLELYVLPFLSQDDYDRLLWSCDLNLVRGEDSFVRAQWAGRPLLWHIYPQVEQAHRPKLAAFLARYLEALPTPAAVATGALWQAWNDGGLSAALWRQWLEQEALLRQHAENWCTGLAQQQDLAGQLIQFVRNERRR